MPCTLIEPLTAAEAQARLTRAQDALEPIAAAYKTARVACERSRSAKRREALRQATAAFDAALAKVDAARDALDAAESREAHQARKDARCAAKARAEWLQPRLI